MTLRFALCNFAKRVIWGKNNITPIKLLLFFLGVFFEKSSVIIYYFHYLIKSLFASTMEIMHSPGGNTFFKRIKCLILDCITMLKGVIFN